MGTKPALHCGTAWIFLNHSMTYSILKAHKAKRNNIFVLPSTWNFLHMLHVH